MLFFRKLVLTSLILSLTLASFSGITQTATAASAPPTILSYQGRLTDSGGNLLGGVGTTYYFKFSLWDSATVGAGNKVWPPSSPATTTATVRQGVFNVNIGDTANGYPDALNINFANYPQLYLQVEVSADNNSSETLTPRQQMTSSIYAQVAGAVVGSTTPSAFGTTTVAANSFVTIAATSSNTTGLTIVGAQSQTANLLQIQSNSFTNLFSVSSAGALTATGSTTVGGVFNAISGLSTLSNLLVLGSTTLQNITAANATTTNATTTNLAITGVSNFLLKTLTGGAVVAAVAGTDYATPANIASAYPFPTNATSTQLTFNGGAVFSNATSSGTFAVTGSTTIASLLNVGGALNANGPLTVVGSATTTLNQYIGGRLGVNDQSADYQFETAGTFLNGYFGVSSNWGNNTVDGDIFAINNGGNVGIGTTSAYARFALLATSTTGVNAPTTLFAIASSTGGAATSTLFSISNTGSTTLFQLASSLLKTTAAGTIVAAVAGSDYQAAGNYATFTYPFPSSATSSLLTFSGGLLAAASSTIGNGAQGGGLTVNGGATTTGNAYIAGTIGIGTQSNAVNAKLQVTGGSIYIQNTGLPATLGVSRTDGQWGAFAAGTGLSTFIFSQGSSFNIKEASLGETPTSTSYDVNNYDLTVATGGNVGIGTGLGTPRNKLDVSGAGVFGSAYAGVITAPANGLLVQGVSGFGTTSPYAQLSIFGGGDYTARAASTLFAIGSTTAGAATSTLFSVNSTGSTTLYQLASSLLKTTAAGTIVAAVAGSDYLNGTSLASAYPFQGTNNSTSTLTGFTSGIYATASTTIGGGTQVGGLTVSGGATTTGVAYFGSSVGVGTTTPSATFAVKGGAGQIVDFSTSGGVAAFHVMSGGNVGLGTTTPFSKLTLLANSGDTNTTLFTISSTTGAGVTSSLFSISNTGSTTLFQLPSSLLKTNANGTVIAAVAGVDYQAAGNYANFGYEFLNNATSTQLAFNGGATFVGATTTALAVNGSTTISALLNVGGNALFGSSVGIGTTSPFAKLSVHSSNGNSILFALASSTATATSTIFSVSNTGIFNYGINSTSTIPNNTPYAWTIATSSTATPLFSINTTSGNEQVNIGNPGTDVYIGDTNSSPNLVFQNSATIKTFSGGTLTFGASSDIVNFGVNTGFGSTSPFAKVGIHANYGDTNKVLFTIGSSSLNATSTLFSVFSNGRVSSNVANNVDSAFTIATSTGNVPIFSISTVNSAVGKVGIGTSSPWGKFSIEMGPLNPGFVVSNQGSSTPSFFISGVNNNGNVGVGTSTPFAKLSVYAALGDNNPLLFAIGSTSNGIANQTLFSVDNTGIASYANVINFTGGQSTSTLLNVNGRNFLTSSSTSGLLVMGLGAGEHLLATSSAVAGNTVFGVGALGLATSSLQNTAFGFLALSQVNDYAAVGNTAMGANALGLDTIGFGNSGLGNSALGHNTSGFNNTGVGNLTLNANTTGSRNAAIGASALLSNFTGSNNVAIGNSALINNGSATNTVAIGFQAGAGSAASVALYSNQGSTLIGYQAGTNDITGSDYNTLIGYQSGIDISTGFGNIGVGASSTNITTGSNNLALGNFTFFPSQTANNQLNIGNLIFGTIPATSTAFALPTSGLIGIGTSSPFAKLSVQANRGDTAQVLFAIGSSTVNSTTTLFMVANTGFVGVGTTTNWFATSSILTVGNTSIASGKTIALFANAGGAAYISNTAISFTSDQRLKKNISAIGTSALNGVLALQAVQYNFNSEADGTQLHTGFLAQQVQPIFPDLVSTNSQGYLAFNYGGLTPYLASAIQAQQLEIEGIASSSATTTQIFITNQNVFLGFASSTATSTPAFAVWNATATTSASVVVNGNFYVNGQNIGSTVASSTATTTTDQLVNGPFNVASTDLRSALTDAFAALGGLTQSGVRELGVAMHATIGVFDKVFAREVHTDKLCVGQTCVTQAQFLAMVQASQVGSGSNTGGSGSSSGGNASTTSPIITINGNNPATINVGDTYSDLGALATDSQGHDLTVHTFVNGSLLEPVVIDTSSVATDTIDYVATDTWGNTATSTRTVVVQ